MSAGNWPDGFNHGNSSHEAGHRTDLKSNQSAEVDVQLTLTSVVSVTLLLQLLNTWLMLLCPTLWQREGTPNYEDRDTVTLRYISVNRIKT